MRFMEVADPVNIQLTIRNLTTIFITCNGIHQIWG